jgi:hypothetical protein
MKPDSTIDCPRFDNGEFSVYPGHPLVVAIFAMKWFNKCSDALKPNESGFSSLSAHGGVPGSGCACSNCCCMFRKIQSGELKLEDVPTWADDCWKRFVGPGTGNLESEYQPGLEQAAKCKETFLEAARRWDWS